MKYSLGIDLGTSYFKFGIYDEPADLLGLARLAVEKDTGSGNLCELPVDRFIALLKDGITQACQQAKTTQVKSKSIGIKVIKNLSVFNLNRKE
jgi:sugar (pentulose or hexulose) kinase